MTQRRQKKRKRSEKGADTTLSRTDRTVIVTTLAGIFATMIVGGAFISRQHNEQAVEDLLKGGIETCRLNDEQVARIRDTERKFHGSGNIFTRPSHTLQETREHYQAVRDVMSPEIASHFLTAGGGARSAEPAP